MKPGSLNGQIDIDKEIFDQIKQVIQDIKQEFKQNLRLMTIKHTTSHVSLVYKLMTNIQYIK